MRFFRVTSPNRPIANGADYERGVDSSQLPQIGDRVQFATAEFKIEMRVWDYSGDVPVCALGIDFLGDSL